MEDMFERVRSRCGGKEKDDKKPPWTKGFTLMEMLIVVAIIAVLAAVSIPVFNGQLEKARKAADEANMRVAKAVAAANYLSYLSGDPTTECPRELQFYNNIETGTFQDECPKSYKKYKPDEYSGDVIQITNFNEETGIYTLDWYVIKS